MNVRLKNNAAAALIDMVDVLVVIEGKGGYGRLSSDYTGIIRWLRCLRVII